MSAGHLDLFTRGNITYPFNLDAECTEIHAVNFSHQCLFVTTVEDCVEIIEYLDYNVFVFCTFGMKRVAPAVIIVVMWLSMLFIALGVTSNYFLCPALFTISKHLGLSQNVAGVTLLAFGNGAPDIFSSVAGLQKASAELAIASLVGAGTFVTTVVAGSVFLTQSFPLMCRPFLRDVCFYLIAIGWTLGLFYTGNIYPYHGIGFVCLYFVYIVVVLGSRFIYVSRQKQKESSCEKKPKKEKDPDFQLKIKGANYDRDPQATAVVLKAFYYGGFEWLDEQMEPVKNSKIYAIDNNGCSNTGSYLSVQNRSMSSTEKLNPSSSSGEEERGEFWDFMCKVCPVNIKKWPALKWYKKVGALCKSPAILIMRITVPVLDTSSEDQNWNRYLICTQCITGPIFICLVSEYAFYVIGGVFPLLVVLIVICAAFAILVYCTSDRWGPPSYHWLFAYLGFAVAVTWIYCLANEIVALLQVLGVVFNLSDAILGLTILAWGNSLSDFLSNVAVARKQFPRMAISACFGGPLLALLLGLGIPCIIEVVKGRAPAKYPLMFSGQFAVLFGTIGFGLLATTSLMCLWRFQTRRFYGAFLIMLYAVFVTISLLEEMNIFTLPV